MMKHGAVKLKNQTVSDIVSVGVVHESGASVCELGPDQQRKGSVLIKKLTETNKFVLTKTEEAGSDLP